MLKFTYETDSFEQTFNLPAGSLYTEDCIIEVDLMNDIAPDWIYTQGRAAAVAILHGNRVIVCVAETEEDEYFKEEVLTILTEKAKMTRIFASNWQYAHILIKTLTGVSFPMYEVKPIVGKGWGRDKCYQYLREGGVLVGDKEIYDNYSEGERSSVKDWQGWLSDGEHQHLMDISQHIIGNILKDALIHKYAHVFMETGQ